MRMSRTALLVLGLLAASPARGTAPEDEPKDRAPAGKHRGTFTAGKDTTYITGPFDKDGYPDYAAALNERLSQGVSPNENAIVLLWQALGPRPDGTPYPAEYFQALRIGRPPEEGHYFIDLARFLKDKAPRDKPDAAEPTRDRLRRVTERTWTAKDHPDLAAWLEANEKPLAAALQASRRLGYFSPVILSKDSPDLITALTPPLAGIRDLANALAARALLRAGEGAADEAWQDLLAMHRLGRVVGQGGQAMEALVGYGIDGIACKAELAFIERIQPDAGRIGRCLCDLQNLPPPVAPAEQLDGYERFEFLNCLMLIDRYGLDYLEALASRTGPDPAAKRLRSELVKGVDWDRALRNGNRWYDRLAAAARDKDRVSRREKRDRIEADLKGLRESLLHKGDLAGLLVGDGSRRGEVIGDLLACLVVPAAKIVSAADQARQRRDNVLVAFALAAYQRDHGRYPQGLQALVPRYLPQVPLDSFSGKPLVYRPSGNGYLLYSVGVNGKDEDGRGPESEPPGDDLSVRMPLPPLAPLPPK
jgi:hypothetical protein